MKKKEADRFIESHISAFGLTGYNAPVYDQKFPIMMGSSVFHFSKENHFVWGYDGKSCRNRISSTCMYFTNYQKLPYTGSILPLSSALVDIAEQVNKAYPDHLFIVNRGRYEDYAFVDACQETNLPFTQVLISYDGNIEYEYDPYMPSVICNVSQDSLLSMAENVVPWLRTSSINVLLDIFISTQFGEHLVYPSRMKFVNHNYTDEGPCGPANWALCDEEEDTALMRHDWFCASPTHVIPNLATWSPELMASQLNDPHLIKCLTSNATATAEEATREMWKSVSPIDQEFDMLPEWWEETQEAIRDIHDGGKHNEHWYTPLHRLLPKLGVTYPVDMQDHTYGQVF